MTLHKGRSTGSGHTAATEPLWDTPRLEQYLGKPPGTGRQWRYRGVGPRYIKAAGSVRYRWCDIEAWLSENEHGGETR